MKIKDKAFVPFLTEGQISEAVNRLGKHLSKIYCDSNPLFVVVLNGSFIFAADLLRKIDFHTEISFIRVASYHGTKSTGEVTELLGLNEPVLNRKIVLIEDIVDTGLTVEKLRSALVQKGASTVEVVTLLFKPAAFKGITKPEYIGIEIGNDFVVGYGLDYDGLGRQLKEIYILSS
jgi:hypoxanthine phosphoribosyltransferase